MIPIRLPKEQKDRLIGDLKQFFEAERSETIGDLAAGLIVDFMIREMGPYLYNKGIEDARRLIMEKMASMEDELYSLQKPVRIVNSNRIKP